MGGIVDAVVVFILAIVALVNFLMGFRKCGMNNAFTALNIVLSCWLSSVISQTLINGALQQMIVESGEGAAVVQTIWSVLLFVIFLLVLSLLFSICFGIIKWRIRKIKVESKMLKLVGRIASVCVSVVVYAAVFWVLLGVVHTTGSAAIDEMIGTSFFYSSNPLQAFCDQSLNIGGLIESIMQTMPPVA